MVWVLGIAMVLAGLVGPAMAQDSAWPRCSERLDGQTRCESASLCTCHYDNGGILSGTVAAWRWSCDMLKMCGDPAPADSGSQPLPQGFSFAPQLTLPGDQTSRHR